GKDIARPVVLKQTFTLKPTPRRLKAYEEVLRVTEIVECLKLEREDPNGCKHSEHESHEIPSIPARLRANFRSEHLPPAKPHWAKYGFALFFRNVLVGLIREPGSFSLVNSKPRRKRPAGLLFSGNRFHW